MLPYFSFFGISLPVPELLLLLGVYFGLMLAERFAVTYEQDAESIYELGFYSVIGGLVGARLAYAAEHFDAFSQTPGSLLSPNLDLFDPWGGFAIAVLVGTIYGQRKGLRLLPTLDALTPAFALFAVVLPLANLASGDNYGSPTTLPWAIDLWGALRHPTQVYEAISAGLILYLLWPTQQNKARLSGSDILRFIMFSAGARLFFEGFHGNSATLIFDMRTAQILAWMILALALWGYANIHKDKV